MQVCLLFVKRKGIVTQNKIVVILLETKLVGTYLLLVRMLI